MNSPLQTLLIPLITIIGLIVLIAIGKVAADIALPVIVGLAGVHAGAAITSTASSTGGK